MSLIHSLWSQVAKAQLSELRLKTLSKYMISREDCSAQNTAWESGQLGGGFLYPPRKEKNRPRKVIDCRGWLQSLQINHTMILLKDRQPADLLGDVWSGILKEKIMQCICLNKGIRYSLFHFLRQMLPKWNEFEIMGDAGGWKNTTV